MKAVKSFTNKYSWIWALIGSFALWILLGIISKKNES